MARFVEFKRVSLGRDSFGVSHCIYDAVGLPAGVKCYYAPEQADRPRGEWYVATRRGAAKKTLRCKSREDAASKAAAWCQKAIGAGERGTRGTKASGCAARRSRAASQ